MQSIVCDEERISRASLCGLLHDVGKPVLRYILRRNERLEEEVRDQRLREFLRALGIKKHETVGKKFLEFVEKTLANLCECQDHIKEAIGLADVIAAAERGIEKEYKRLKKLWNDIENYIEDELGSGYKHYVTPLLSPLWLLEVLNRNSYNNFIGPTAMQRFSGDMAREELREVLQPILEAMRSESPNPQRIAYEISKSIISPIINEKIWYPPVLVTTNILRGLRLNSYRDAQKDINYRDIVEYLFRGLRWAINIYDLKSCKGLKTGFVETVSEILKYSVSLVPSAVYISIAPDIGLYSHSKLVSAISAALAARYPEPPKSYRLLVIDTRGIQRFISAPIKAKAASRVIRGRSLLVELALESAAELVLKVFGGLPSTNIVVSEGGTLLIVVPDYGDEEIRRRIESLRNILNSIRWLKWSIAYSIPIDKERARYLAALERGGGFPEVLEDLEKRLAMAKIRDRGEILGIEVGEGDIEGFDAITWEAIAKREILGGLGFRVSQELVGPNGYASIISGEKLEPGDLVGEATHLSLVAGSIARNLVAVASIYLYNVKDRNIIPASDGVKSLRKSLYRCLCERFQCGIAGFDKALYTILGREIREIRVAIIPFEDLGALHILISTRDPPSSARESVANAITALSTMISRCGYTLNRVASESSDIVGKVRIKFVNVASEFSEALWEGTSYEAINGIAKTIINAGFDISIGTFYTGTYHPVKENGSLVDLDEYDIIAMAKIDGDQIGEVRFLLSLSPSRLITFSDLLTLNVVGKLHLALLEMSGKYGSDVIVLYAGGDDASLYGEWRGVIQVIHRLYDGILTSLKPLSFSTGISIDKGDAPLLMMFSRAREALEAVKRFARGSVSIEQISAQVIEKKGSITVVRAIPTDYRGWPSNSILTSLRNLAESLKYNVLKSLAEYKGDIHMLSSIADESLRIFERISNNGRAQLDLIKVGNMLSYYCARRGKDLEDLEKLLGIKICSDQGEGIRKSLIRVANAKSLLDLLYLAQRILRI
jgi:CRISPR-associated protein Csm1